MGRNYPAIYGICVHTTSTALIRSSSVCFCDRVVGPTSTWLEISVSLLPHARAGFASSKTVTLEKQTQEFMRRFEASVRHHPEIEECYLMTGAADYVLKVASEDTKAYEALHSTVLSRLPGVALITSSFALRNVATSGEIAS